MKLWPVVIDSQPAYLRGRGRSTSLLLAPFGTSVLLEYVTSAIRLITDNAPLIIAPEQGEPRAAEWMRAVCPNARLVRTASEFADALANPELSDALLFVDPRCMPTHGLGLAQLVRHHSAEPRVSHHLVAFERAIAGTKERVCFDTAGQVRGIQRYYEQATWPFISGIAATLLPWACGVVTHDLIPRSLFELRQLLISRGVPSRDVPVEGGALDLADEREMLAANDALILDVTSSRYEAGAAASPVYVGSGHSIHKTARMKGPIVVHPDASIDATATVLGPAVVGAGARIGAGAVVAHAVIGPDSIVPPDMVVRDRAWFSNTCEAESDALEDPAIPYGERLVRASIDAQHRGLTTRLQEQGSHQRHLALKRAFDSSVAVLGLVILSPILALVALAILLESKGPVFFGDKREGLHGHLFSCWKFRTMYTGADLAQRDLKALDHTDGPHFKVDRDPRVTRVGRILRALNVDEIPQLFNVLLGQMSLVGPRPSPFRENQVCVPWRTARLSVRPGITGFWQVCRHNRSEGDFHQWIEYDLLYVQHMSPWLDLKILGATLLTLGGKVAHVPASWLAGGDSVAEEGLAVEVTPQEPREVKVA
jgi:lipopolysaccharide/colanic/teichoic acid biosynthesis glycosyltransferase